MHIQLHCKNTTIIKLIFFFYIYHVIDFDTKMAFSLLLTSFRRASLLTRRSCRSYYSLPRDVADYYRPEPVEEPSLSELEMEEQLSGCVTNVVTDEILYVLKKNKNDVFVNGLDLAKYDLLDNFTIRPGQVSVGKKEINVPGDYDEIKNAFEEIIARIASDPDLIEKARNIGFRYSGGVYCKM